jgi:hypothetical protein
MLQATLLFEFSLFYLNLFANTNVFSLNGGTMAIYSDHPSLEAEVIVNDEALPEFTDDDSELQPRTTTTYVEATSGDHFGVRYTVPADLFEHYGVQATVSIDGVYLQNHVNFQSRYIGQDLRNSVIRQSSGIVNGKEIGQKFRSSELSMGESAVHSYPAVCPPRLVRSLGVRTMRRETP